MLIIPAILASAPLALPPEDRAFAAVEPAAVDASAFPVAPVAEAGADGVETPTPVAEPKADAPSAPTPPEDRHRHAQGDSLEGFNRAMFGTWRVLDKAIYRPVAMTYKHVAPKPMRSGIRHLLSNITEPLVFLNFLLQGKPRSASRTLARFMINSTFGVGGLIDVAKGKSINLPHRDNSFGTTLALYGIGPGPYIFLPFLGPSTLRDLVGSTSEGLILPLTIGKPFDTIEYQLSTTVVGGLDLRAESDAGLRALLSGAVDPYATLRATWLQDRAAEIEAIRHGDGAPKAAEGQSELDDPLADPANAGDAKPAAQQPAPELADPLEDPAAKP